MKYDCTVTFVVDTEDYDDVEATNEAVKALVEDMFEGGADMPNKIKIEVNRRM